MIKHVDSVVKGKLFRIQIVKSHLVKVRVQMAADMKGPGKSLWTLLGPWALGVPWSSIHLYRIPGTC